MEKTEIDGINYFLRNQPEGYGYQIISAEPTGVVSPRGFKRYNHTVLFHTYNRELAIEIFEKFKNGEVVTDFPDTSNDVPPNKVFVHRSKHFTGYYQANTPEELNKVLRKILKDEYKECIDSMNPVENIINDSGVEFEEEIESIPIEAVKIEVREKWNKYQKLLKENERYIREYKNLRSIVFDDKGNSLDAMHTYEGDTWELETLTVVK